MKSLTKTIYTKNICRVFICVFLTSVLSPEIDARNRSAKNKTNACESPKSLQFSIIPDEEIGQAEKLYQPIVDALKQATGKTIKFYLPTSYASVVEAMIGGWVDIAVLGANLYVIAKERDPSIEVFATYAKKKGYLQKEGPGYQAVLLSKKGSTFTTVRSLENTLLGLVDPASTSGNLIPRVLFPKQIQKDIDDYFTKVVYTGGHDLSAMAVKEGRIDAAFVATSNFDNVVKRGLIQVSDFNILWESPVVPLDPFAYRGTLCDDIKQNIKHVFLTLHTRPDSKKLLTNVNAVKFVEMRDADYDVIRELRREQKDRY